MAGTTNVNYSIATRFFLRSRLSQMQRFLPNLMVTKFARTVIISEGDKFSALTVYTLSISERDPPPVPGKGGGGDVNHHLEEQRERGHKINM